MAALLASDVFIIAGEADADSYDETQVRCLVDLDGPLIPFFTSDDMVKRTSRAFPDFGARSVRIPCRDLWESTRGLRYVLNPHGQYARTFEASEVEALLDGTEPGRIIERVDAPRQVIIGRPHPTPERLLAILATFLADRPCAKEARLGWMTDTDGLAGYLMTVASADREEAIAGFGALGIGEFTDGNSFTVIIEPDTQPPLVLASIEPFYHR